MEDQDQHDHLPFGGEGAHREAVWIHLPDGGRWSIDGPPLTIVGHEADDLSEPIEREPRLNLHQLRALGWPGEDQRQSSDFQAEPASRKRSPYWRQARRDFLVIQHCAGAEITALAARFPAESQYRIMYWTGRSTALFELVDSTNPALGAMLATFLDPDSSISTEDVTNLASMRQADLAKWLGLGDGTWKLIRKVEASAASYSRLYSFTQRLGEDTALRKIASHLESINADALEILASRWLFDRVTPNFVSKLVRSESSQLLLEDEGVAFSQAIEEIKPYAELIDHGSRFDNPRQLTRFVGKAYRRFGPPQRVNALRSSEFITPIPAEPSCIEPIRTGDELIREAWEMDSCAAADSTVEVLNTRRAAVYRILPKFGLERATCMIERPESGRIWRLTEIEGPPSRRRVRGSTVASVAWWLANAQGRRSRWSLVQLAR